MLRTVDVAAEMRAFFGQFAVAAERKYLEAAAIGKDRALPAVELVQTAGFVDYIHARAQIQMVGIAENDLSLYIVAQFVEMYAFYRTGCADRHEYRCLDDAVVGFYKSGTGLAVITCIFECKLHLEKFVGIYSGFVKSLEVCYYCRTVFGICHAKPARGCCEYVY